MEMQTIMVIILIAYSSKCYNFVSLHAAKENERAAALFGIVAVILQANANNNLKAKPVCAYVCVFVLRVFYLFIFITIAIYCNWIIGASCATLDSQFQLYCVFCAVDDPMYNSQYIDFNCR